MIDEFIVPCVDVNGISKKAIYLCGNSLGLQPRALHHSVSNQLDKWGKEGVEGHFTGNLVLTCDDFESVLIKYHFFN